MDVMTNAAAPETQEVTDESVAIDTEKKSRKYLVFITDDLHLGVDANYVVEILNNHTITPLPMTPPYVRGIFNMRGQIIPILDIRLKLGKPSANEDLLIVISYEDTQVGILVDSVDQMVDIADDCIVPMPSKSPQRLVSGMCTLPDTSTTMLVLDCEELLAHE